MTHFTFGDFDLVTLNRSDVPEVVKLGYGFEYLNLVSIIIDTLGDLKLGLVCVTNFGESPNFLDMGCLAKTRNSQFFGHGLFCRIFTDFFLFFRIFEKSLDMLI